MNATTPELVRASIRAQEIQVGDRLDASGKTRVARGHDRADEAGEMRVLVQTKTRGARSPSIRTFNADETVSVWRKSEAESETAPTAEETTR
jgi:hypothetical protein